MTKRYRDAQTGQYVTEEHAATHQGTTVGETDTSERIKELEGQLALSNAQFEVQREVFLGLSRVLHKVLKKPERSKNWTWAQWVEFVGEAQHKIKEYIKRGRSFNGYPSTPPPTTEGE